MVTAWVVNDSRSFTEGQTAVLACQSDSHGDVRLAWMKDDEQLGSDDDWQIRETDDSSVLTLSDLTAADAGEYVCVGTRDHESVTSTPLSISVTGLVAQTLCYTVVWCLATLAASHRIALNDYIVLSMYSLKIV